MNRLDFLRKYKNKKILVAPLNWGLGHATRCVPLIDRLNKDNEVVLASDGLALQWLKNQYPLLDAKELPGYDIGYDSQYMWLNMLKSSPRLIAAIRSEHQLLQQWIRQEGFDLVISDHRLGLYSDLCDCVIVAHQITIPHANPILRGMISNINKGYLNRYNEVWIPDFEDRSIALAGDISEVEGLATYRYIDPLSRLKKCEVVQDIDILISLSGPEPSRTELEELLLSVFVEKSAEYNIVFIRGVAHKTDLNVETDDIEVIRLADTLTLNDKINRSKLVICRAGYSSIMDLHQLKQKAILIPTPAQPEQAYLGKYYKSKSTHYILEQSDLDRNLMKMIEKALEG